MYTHLVSRAEWLNFEDRRAGLGYRNMGGSDRASYGSQPQRQRRLHRLRAHLQAPAALPTGSAPTPTLHQTDWQSIDAPFTEAAALGKCTGAGNPLVRLSRGDVPAVILRRAMPKVQCAGLIRRFAERGLLPESFVPFISADTMSAQEVSSVFGQDRSKARGGYRWVGLEELGKDPDAAVAERLDIGTALGNLGDNQPAFFEDAARSRSLYQTLFDGLPTHPIDLMYGALSQLSGGQKTVRTAVEPDGREYCPCIYRSHMPDYGYAPHVDSVRYRERRTDYEIFRFSTQFGGILLLQAPVRSPLLGEGRTPGYTPPSDRYHDTIMYNAPCTRTDVAELMADERNQIPGRMLKTSAFRDFATHSRLPACPIDLEVGDMYFFKSCAAGRLAACHHLSGSLTERLMAECVSCAELLLPLLLLLSRLTKARGARDSLHEVPGFAGDKARVVQATFIGYSEDDDEIMVWS